MTLTRPNQLHVVPSDVQIVIEAAFLRRVVVEIHYKGLIYCTTKQDNVVIVRGGPAGELVWNVEK
jgi:hypothetical protein